MGPLGEEGLVVGDGGAEGLRAGEELRVAAHGLAGLALQPPQGVPEVHVPHLLLHQRGQGPLLHVVDALAPAGRERRGPLLGAVQEVGPYGQPVVLLVDAVVLETFGLRLGVGLEDLFAAGEFGADAVDEGVDAGVEEQVALVEDLVDLVGVGEVELLLLALVEGVDQVFPALEALEEGALDLRAQLAVLALESLLPLHRLPVERTHCRLRAEAPLPLLLPPPPVLLHLLGVLPEQSRLLARRSPLPLRGGQLTSLWRLKISLR